MTRQEIESGVAKLLSITVGRPISATELVVRESEAKWDSLKHVELILMLEESFSIRFDESEMAELRSSDEIVRAIEKKCAA